jgi:hypothetical protein
MVEVGWVFDLLMGELIEWMERAIYIYLVLDHLPKIGFVKTVEMSLSNLLDIKH